MKKTLAMLLASTMMLSMLASCSSSDSGDTGSTGGTTGGTTTTTPSGGDTTTSTVDISGADLMVVTSYGGDDGNRQNYDAAYQAFAAATGVNVIDTSTTADESWKATVNADFETGAEPDVLFYFAGVDADAIINGGGVVSIDTIRSEYPSYANNMKDSLLPVSPADGKQYAVPVNGYWEGLFVNTAVLADAGVEVPGADYTWDQFLVDCQTLKDAGYT
ncbi:MAG: ABC transporter substrate-binding protein, partial [Eubacteriales bacterium]